MKREITDRELVTSYIIRTGRAYIMVDADPMTAPAAAILHLYNLDTETADEAPAAAVRAALARLPEYEIDPPLPAGPEDDESDRLRKEWEAVTY